MSTHLEYQYGCQTYSCDYSPSSFHASSILSKLHLRQLLTAQLHRPFQIFSLVLAKFGCASEAIAFDFSLLEDCNIDLGQSVSARRWNNSAPDAQGCAITTSITSYGEDFSVSRDERYESKGGQEESRVMHPNISKIGRYRESDFSGRMIVTLKRVKY